MKMPIIALGRQFGSGGREIGKRLAEKLNIRCYDRELITLAAQKAELREELFAGREEKAPNPWLFTGVYEGGPQVRKGQPAEDILFEMQSQVILELAQKDPCIIVGRCADAILKSAGILRSCQLLLEGEKPESVVNALVQDSSQFLVPLQNQDAVNSVSLCGSGRSQSGRASSDNDNII